ncbi:MAG TPA: DUF998 domain-containing protein [Gemmatimonadaceae bacterium]|nr:DUF998 domain-containing protein [Gemmatimonadaceae bacterium]
MTTIRIPQTTAAAAPSPATVRGRTRLQDNLLICGILAAFAYVVTDVLGALRYPGYDFTSQGVSELMAVGAPTKDLVNSVFIVYGVLAVALAVGVLRESSGRRTLRVTGLLLLGYALAGMFGSRFPAYPRGAGGLNASLPHIILTAVLVLLMLGALGFGAYALGTRFRIYSLVTLGTIVALGVASGVYGSRLAAQQSTPGFGIVERGLIYAFLVWAAVLGVALVRRHAEPAVGRAE